MRAVICLQVSLMAALLPYATPITVPVGTEGTAVACKDGVYLKHNMPGHVTYNGILDWNPFSIDTQMPNDEPNSSGLPTIEGDIYVDPIPSEKLPECGATRSKRKLESDTWPKNIIPWEINPGARAYSESALGKIHTAMRIWEKFTCIKFVPRSAKPDVGHSKYISITNDFKCSSTIGYKPALIVQPLSLSEALCFSNIGTVLHELGHILGLIHEHTRTDRDDYVSINAKAIGEIFLSNFVKNFESRIPPFNPYDLGSVMHYRAAGFSKDGRASTILSRNLKKQDLMGQRDGLSYYDIKAVNINYQCQGSCKNRCENEGYPHSYNGRCDCVCPEGLSGSVCDKIDSSCGGILNVLEGQKITLQSPDYPNAPPSDCEKGYWLIQAPVGFYLEVTFNYMNISMSTPTLKDGTKCAHQIEVRNSLLGQRGDIFCGAGPMHTINTELGTIKNKLMIVLNMTDKSVSRGNGFSATITAYQDACLSNPCHINAQCISKRSLHFTCKCTDGYTGRLCDVITDGAVSCDFSKGMCDLKNSKDDQLDFETEFFAAKYKEEITGSSSNNKYFLVTPTQYSVPRNSEARLLTPVFSKSGSEYRCLSFYSVFIGDKFQEGTLTVSLVDPITRSSFRTIKTLNKATNKNWTQTTQEIKEYKDYMVEFKFKSHPRIPFNSYVGLDEIAIKPQRCFESPCSSNPCGSYGSVCVEKTETSYKCICTTGTSGENCNSYDTNGFVCDFNSEDLCGWIQDHKDDFNWIRTLGLADALKRTGPVSSVDGNGYYLLVDSSTVQEGKSARILTPILNYKGSVCLSFYYNMYGGRVGSLRIKLMVNKQLQPKSLFEKSQAGAAGWVHQSVDISLTSENSQIVFEATVGEKTVSDIAIDDVKMTRSRCDERQSQTNAIESTGTATNPLQATNMVSKPLSSNAVQLSKLIDSSPPINAVILTKKLPDSKASTGRQGETTLSASPQIINAASINMNKLKKATDGIILECSFETDLCPSDLDVNDPNNVLIRTQLASPVPSGPYFASVGAWYILLDCRKSLISREVVTISTKVIPSTGPICIVFDYHASGSIPGKLSVYSEGSGRRQSLWSSSGVQEMMWRTAAVTAIINMNERVSIVLESLSTHSDIALDTLKILKGTCERSE